MKALRNLMVLLALSLGPVSTIAMAQTVPAPVEVSDEVLEQTEGQWVVVVVQVVKCLASAGCRTVAVEATKAAANAVITAYGYYTLGREACRDFGPCK